ncbi:MAG: hypothetical protein NTX45_02280 [Proteobacteria bacterium]|nr:hypothetical protein [Pseudomonadota bacterium]
MNGVCDLKTRKRQILENKLERLWEDYQAAIDQSTAVLGAVESKKLQKQADAIYKQIEQLDAELRLLDTKPTEIAADAETAQSDIGRWHRELKSKLPEIDFKLLEETLLRIIKDHSDEGCASLLLFQKSSQMGGEWCAARIRELLQRKTRQGQFRHYPLAFQATERVEGMALLRRLGPHLKLDPASHDLRGFARQVVQTLCGSLQTGSVVLIECGRCDDFLRDPDVFRWLVEDFWGDMVHALAAVANDYEAIKLIFLLYVDGPLPDNAIAEKHCCTLDDYQKHKLLEITLKPWDWDDIHDWIASYSCLGLTKPQLKRMTDKIYNATDGLPGLVAHELLKECCPSVGG